MSADHKAATAFALGKDYSPNPAVKNLAAAFLEAEADLARAVESEAELISVIEGSDVELEWERTVRAEAQQKYLLLSKQHARLCDQVYEEDGETLKITAERKAREETKKKYATLVQVYNVVEKDWTRAEQRTADLQRKLEEVKTVLREYMAGHPCSNKECVYTLKAIRTLSAQSNAAAHDVETSRVEATADNASAAPSTISTGATMLVTKDMIDRFLSWPLPENFSPDAGISFKADYNEGTKYPGKHKPVGTNLLDADQARQMLEYVLSAAPDAALSGLELAKKICESCALQIGEKYYPTMSKRCAEAIRAEIERRRTKS